MTAPARYRRSPSPLPEVSRMRLGVQRGRRVVRHSVEGRDEDDPGFEDAVRAIEDG